jgi:hypothetical protein
MAWPQSCASQGLKCITEIATQWVAYLIPCFRVPKAQTVSDGCVSIVLRAVCHI